MALGSRSELRACSGKACSGKVAAPRLRSPGERRDAQNPGRPPPRVRLAQTNSSLVLEACDISSSSGNGVGVEGATLQLKDSTVHDCQRHGVAAYGGFEGVHLREGAYVVHVCARACVRVCLCIVRVHVQCPGVPRVVLACGVLALTARWGRDCAA